MTCTGCKDIKININHFKILKVCKSDYESKINEALLIRQRNPPLNKQAYEGVSLFY